MITPGVYKHYKGNLYRVLFVAKNSANGHLPHEEDVVVYVALYGDGRVSTRPAWEFEQSVDARHSASGPESSHMGPRFIRVGP